MLQVTYPTNTMSVIKSVFLCYSWGYVRLKAAHPTESK